MLIKCCIFLLFPPKQEKLPFKFLTELCGLTTKHSNLRWGLILTVIDIIFYVSVPVLTTLNYSGPVWVRSSHYILIHYHWEYILRIEITQCHLQCSPSLSSAVHCDKLTSSFLHRKSQDIIYRQMNLQDKWQVRNDLHCIAGTEDNPHFTQESLIGIR